MSCQSHILPSFTQGSLTAPSRRLQSACFQLITGHAFEADYSDTFRRNAGDTISCPTCEERYTIDHVSFWTVTRSGRFATRQALILPPSTTFSLVQMAPLASHFSFTKPRPSFALSRLGQTRHDKEPDGQPILFTYSVAITPRHNYPLL
jgi:hypothetical protein